MKTWARVLLILPFVCNAIPLLIVLCVAFYTWLFTGTANYILIQTESKGDGLAGWFAVTVVLAAIAIEPIVYFSVFGFGLRGKPWEWKPVDLDKN